MKATLEFNLEEIEDRKAHLRCTKSLDICIVLWDIHQKIYEDDLTLDELKDCIVFALKHYNVDLEELM